MSKVKGRGPIDPLPPFMPSCKRLSPWVILKHKRDSSFLENIQKFVMSPTKIYSQDRFKWICDRRFSLGTVWQAVRRFALR